MLEMKQPNIIFLFSDQQRVDTVSAYGKALGAKLNLTPHLDALAEEGTLFLNHMTCHRFVAQQELCCKRDAMLRKFLWRLTMCVCRMGFLR